MDTLLFIVMVPFFLLLGLSWVVGLIRYVQVRLMSRREKRKAKEENQIYHELLATGMPWWQAAYEADKQVYGK